MKKHICENHTKIWFFRRTHLGICDFCVKLGTLRKLAQNAGDKHILKARMLEHTKLHQGERKTYHSRRKDSERSPDQSWSIIMDNSDKIQIPHKV
jgi:hypothetical protein